MIKLRSEYPIYEIIGAGEGNWTLGLNVGNVSLYHWATPAYLKSIIKQRFFISKSLKNQENLEWTTSILRPNIIFLKLSNNCTYVATMLRQKLFFKPEFMTRFKHNLSLHKRSMKTAFYISWALTLAFLLTAIALV